jgi:iron complex transport system substrate-binding protein
MGELIAKAVYAGAKDAVCRQNGLVPNRSVFQRLKERKLTIFGLVADCPCGVQGSALAHELEQLLLESEIAGFIEAALVISDQYERGLITNISGFEIWCDQMTAKIAGKPVPEKQVFEFSKPVPPILNMAFDALLNGVVAKVAPD